MRSVKLDGTKAKHVKVRLTNRGVEVTVPASAHQQHTLTITAG